MLGITIKEIEITVNTNNGVFSTYIPFKKGLNIIRAENSSGKSTCINAIAYSLGLESILGPTRKKPFPKSLYEVIYKDKKEDEEFVVINSQVRLVVENKLGISATFTRDILGDKNKVTISYEGETEDYFLGSAGSIGSAASSRGFHYWLNN
ncbi:AAA family ATPase [Grimontia marina]|uniref:Rad50/SbcC-type AAA domain-containing protein n=1 Tax=Grimontia marina TaxID=646534 RepID=A0A128FK08_9GAMM|nr:AAA family ATPase [Grimontia marina]CZF87147.1 hypothetical protein GMA8713_05198 [Grimontia marina]